MKTPTFIVSFEKTAAAKLPKMFLEATKNMNPKSPRFSKKGFLHMLKRRKGGA